MSEQDDTPTAFIGVGKTTSEAYNMLSHPYLFKELGGPQELAEKTKNKFAKF